MAFAFQRRRGTTSAHTSFTGLAGELTVDTDKNTVVVHNGSTAGGFPLAKENFPTNSQTGTTYTLVLADNGKIVELSNTAAIALTVPTNATVAFPIGVQIQLLQTNTGQVTVAGTSGVTVNASPGLKIRGQWSSATLVKRATDTWVLLGDITA
jgi:RNase P/RNase MRP subunit p29